MSAHVLYPSLDTQNVATLSKPILTGLLREEMGFKGLIITDDLSMGSINENKKNIPISSEVSTTKSEEILNENISPELATEPVVEEKKPVREKSESTASEADKAKDESKS